jgi:hypothetical protein
MCRSFPPLVSLAGVKSSPAYLEVISPLIEAYRGDGYQASLKMEDLSATSNLKS